MHTVNQFPGLRLPGDIVKVEQWIVSRPVHRWRVTWMTMAVLHTAIPATQSIYSFPSVPYLRKVTFNHDSRERRHMYVTLKHINHFVHVCVCLTSLVYSLFILYGSRWFWSDVIHHSCHARNLGDAGCEDTVIMRDPTGTRSPVPQLQPTETIHREPGYHPFTPARPQTPKTLPGDTGPPVLLDDQFASRNTSSFSLSLRR